MRDNDESRAIRPVDTTELAQAFRDVVNGPQGKEAIKAIEFMAVVAAGLFVLCAGPELISRYKSAVKAA